jgi:hypothetical protein
LLPLESAGYKQPRMFRSMLAQLLVSVPQARAAVFCDHEGEAVDWDAKSPPPEGASPLTEYDVKICGAQLAAAWLLIDERGKEEGAGGVRELQLRAAQGTLLCQAVQDGYYLVLVLGPRPATALTALAARSLRAAALAFAREM